MLDDTVMKYFELEFSGTVPLRRGACQSTVARPRVIELRGGACMRNLKTREKKKN